MALKTVLATLLAATATAAPSPQIPEPFQGINHGWCTFHMVEDAKITKDLDGRGHNIKMEFYDDSKINWYNQDQTSLDSLQGVEITPYGFEGDPIIMDSLPDGSGDDFIKGWSITYAGETFTTNDKNHCDKGEEVVSCFLSVVWRGWRFANEVLSCNRSPPPSARRGVTTAASSAKQRGRVSTNLICTVNRLIEDFPIMPVSSAVLLGSAHV